MSRRGLCSSSSFASAHPGNAGTGVALGHLPAPAQIRSRGCSTRGEGRKPPQPRSGGRTRCSQKAPIQSLQQNEGPGCGGALPIPVQKAGQLQHQITQLHTGSNSSTGTHGRMCRENPDPLECSVPGCVRTHTHTHCVSLHVYSPAAPSSPQTRS